MLRVLEIQQFLGFFGILPDLEHVNEQFAHDDLLDTRSVFVLKQGKRDKSTQYSLVNPFIEVGNEKSHEGEK